MELWHKDSLMVPAPLLVGIEVNPGPALTEDERKEILTLRHKARWSIGQIAACIHHDPSTVKRFLKSYAKRKHREKNPSLKNQPGQVLSYVILYYIFY
jgi:hypothetical protein